MVDQAPLSEYKNYSLICLLYATILRQECVGVAIQGRDLSFWRFLNDWEVEGVTTLLGKLDGSNGITTEPEIFLEAQKGGCVTFNSAFKREMYDLWEATIPMQLHLEKLNTYHSEVFYVDGVKRVCLTHERNAIGV